MKLLAPMLMLVLELASVSAFPNDYVNMMNINPTKKSYLVSFSPYDKRFKTFKEEYAKSYKTEEEENKRFEIFLDNVMLIEEHNYRYHHGQETFYMDLNHFADMTVDEFEELHTSGRDMNKENFMSCSPYTPKTHVNDTVASIDWREKGAVSPVHMQWMCGSCWTFSATGAIEGQMAAKVGKLTALSNQQMLDCCKLPSCGGCNGGDPQQAFVYVYYQGGLMSYADYPYYAEYSSCVFDSSKVKVKVDSCRGIKEGSEEDMRIALAEEGPLSIAINVDRSLLFYKSGIYSQDNCNSTLEAINHAVVLTGYGQSQGIQFWTLKNSWGRGWGEGGFARIARNDRNMCGIATYASFPEIQLP